MAETQPSQKNDAAPVNENTEILGKKVFFLHPSAYIQNEIISALVQQEHEVYVLKDESKLMSVLRKHPQSILFACVEEVLEPKQWEALIRSVMGDAATKDVAVGVIVNNDNDALKRFYLNTLKVSCGFTAIKPDAVKAIKSILELLKAVDAKGRRKYIRADTRGDPAATLNLSYNGKYFNGAIRDISVVGISCVFKEEIELEKNSLFPDIQIKLQSAIMKVEGIVFGSRAEGEEKIYVIILTQKIDPAVRTKIRSFIQKKLQAKMDQELK